MYNWQKSDILHALIYSQLVYLKFKKKQVAETLFVTGRIEGRNELNFK